MSKKRDSKPPDMELVAAAYRARMAEADLAASYHRIEKLEARAAELEAQLAEVTRERDQLRRAVLRELTARGEAER